MNDEEEIQLQESTNTGDLDEYDSELARQQAAFDFDFGTDENDQSPFNEALQQAMFEEEEEKKSQISGKSRGSQSDPYATTKESGSKPHVDSREPSVEVYKPPSGRIGTISPATSVPSLPSQKEPSPFNLPSREITPEPRIPLFNALEPVHSPLTRKRHFSGVQLNIIRNQIDQTLNKIIDGDDPNYDLEDEDLDDIARVISDPLNEIAITRGRKNQIDTVVNQVIKQIKKDNDFEFGPNDLLDQLNQKILDNIRVIPKKKDEVIKAPDIIEEFNMLVANDVDKANKNLKPSEIKNIADEFLTQINLSKLAPNDVNLLIDDIRTNVKNDNLRFILLEQINKLRAKNLKETVSPLDIIPTIKEGVVGLDITQTTKEATDVFDNIKTLLKRNEQLITSYNKNPRSRGGIANGLPALLTNIFDTIDNLHEISKKSFGVKTKDEDLGIDRDSLSDQFKKEKGQEKLKTLNALLNHLYNYVQNERVGQTQFFQTPSQKQVSQQPILTSKNIQDFLDELKRELADIKSKDEFFFDKLANTIQRGFAVHKPQDIHRIGDVNIFTEPKYNIKEIVIPTHINANDLSKISHALSLTTGVLFDFDGNIILNISGTSQNISAVSAKLAELLKKHMHEKTIRLLYKSASKLGEQVVGGSLTDSNYNRSNYRRLFAKQNIPPKYHKVFTNRHIKGGSLISDDMHDNPVVNYY